MRIERDSMGAVEIPDDALYGAQTARAVENFRVSGRASYPEFIHATISIKKAAAQVNAKLGLLS